MFGTANATVIPKAMVDMYNDAIDPDKPDGDPDRGNVPWIPTEDDGSATHVDPDGYVWAPNATLDQGEDVLCVVAAISGSDIGKCEFTVNHPTFEGGNKNYVNAKDGRGNYSDEGANFVPSWMPPSALRPLLEAPESESWFRWWTSRPAAPLQKFCWLATETIQSDFPAVALMPPAAAPCPSPFPTGPAPELRN